MSTHSVNHFIRTHYALVLLICLSLGLRLFHLDRNPGQLNRDEAALAYNAYLLKETGTDEWGRPWPVALESFGDYKLIGYPLLLVPMYSLFGISDFVTRLPSAVAGCVLVLLSYILARKTGLPRTLSLLVGFVIATTGPLYFFSRMAFEAMVALACFVAALCLLISPRPPTNQNWVWIGLLLMCSVLTYNTPLLYLPVLGFSYVLAWGTRQLRQVLLPLVGTMLIAVGVSFLLGQLISQKSGITIFSDQATRAHYLEFRESTVGITRHVLGNRFVYYGGIVVRNYVAHFGPWFLVQRGGTHPWHSLPGAGHYDWVLYLLAVFGVLAQLVQLPHIINRTTLQDGLFSQGQGVRMYLLLWLMFVPLPAALTVDAPHSTRTLLYLFLIPLFSLYGVHRLTELFFRQRRALVVLTAGAVLASALWYQYQYQFVFPHRQTVNFLLGFREAVRDVSARYPSAPVAVVDQGGYNYILTAWYLRLRPSVFFQTVVRQNPDRIGFRYGQQVGQFHFIAHETDRSSDERILIHVASKETGQWVIEAL